MTGIVGIGSPVNDPPPGPHPGRVINPRARVEVSPEYVAAVAYTAGFRGAALETAVAISFREDTTHDVYAQHLNTDKSVDTGLWQINTVHTQWTMRELFNPQTNASAAYSISGSGRDFSAWYGTFGRLVLTTRPLAKEAIAKMNHKGGAAKVLHDQTWKPGGGSLLGGIGDTISGLAGDVTNPLTGWVGDLTKAIGKYVKRAAEMIGGIILMLMGVFLIAKAAGINPPTIIPV